MAFISAGDLNERVQARELTFNEAKNAWAWTTAWGAWVKAEQSDRTSYFSAVGIGARSVVFTMRKASRINLGLSFLWRGRFCFLTSVADTEQAGIVEIKAALCEPVECRKDADLDPVGCSFPGVLTEKYFKSEPERPHTVTTVAYVLVTPKAIELDPGSLVEAGGKAYSVQACHTLDQWKNEYEILRKEDC
ncbi:hypothetical protein [Oscillibacter sp.]|uniref:hypothetical protein n=1 Tax=Oscillibacter sp. TaxID=1945593 RepID=UPI002899E88E|nr:hypothetical protein [Oscillibacter sp.]